MIFIGFDPDLHYPSYGMVQVLPDKRARIVGYGCLDIPRGYTGYKAVLKCALGMPDLGDRICQDMLMLEESDDLQVWIEAMTMRPRQKEAVTGLLKLQAVSGTFLGQMAWLKDILGVKTDSDFVDPHSWKGQVPKDIHQKRILSRLGITQKDLKLPDKYAKHVVDALGIAYWAAKKENKGRELTLAPHVLR